MKNVILLFSACFLCLNTFAQQNEVNHPIFDEHFNNAENFSGNILIAVNGQPVFKKSYGFANLELEVNNTFETKFRIGSITKQFTSMGIMILQEQGKLNVKDKISSYLSDIPSLWEDITIQQLLTHTSGLIHTWEIESFRETMMLHSSFEQIIERYKAQALLSKPGEKFHYSGVGYFMLATIIEKITQIPYEQFLKEEIFDKAGMNNTGCDNPQLILSNRASGFVADSIGVHNSTYIYMPILTGAGNFYSTVDDLLKWDQILYKNTLISAESKKEMFTPYTGNYAYGWMVMDTEDYYGVFHGGSVPGFQAFIGRYPDKGVLVVALMNKTSNSLPSQGNKFLMLVQKEYGIVPIK